MTVTVTFSQINDVTIDDKKLITWGPDGKTSVTGMTATDVTSWYYLGPDATSTTTVTTRKGLRIGLTTHFKHRDKLSEVTWKKIWKSATSTLWRGQATGDYIALCSFLTKENETPDHYPAAASIRAIHKDGLTKVEVATKVSIVWSTNQATVSDLKITDTKANNGATVLRVKGDNSSGTFFAVAGYYTTLTDDDVKKFSLYTINSS